MFELNFKRYAFLRAVIYIILGISIVINPRTVFNFIGYFITTYFILFAIINIFEAYRNKKVTKIWSLGLFNGIVFIIAGFTVWIFSAAIVSILPIILGLMIISNGLFQIFLGLNNAKPKIWGLYSIFLLISGFIILFNPFQSLMVLFQIFGVTLFFMGIQEIISCFKILK